MPRDVWKNNVDSRNTKKNSAIAPNTRRLSFEVSMAASLRGMCFLRVYLIL